MGDDDIRTWLRRAATGDERPAEPAATVVLLRDRPTGVETLMVKKASKIAFGGMWVFPGGRVDDIDGDGDDELLIACAAAAREAEEECALVVEPDAMVPFSFWLPPPQAPRRFATWFFLAPAPDGDVTVDGGEIRDHRWVAPADALEQRDRGEIELAPPTWVTLWHLARHDSVGAALAAAQMSHPERYETRVAKVGDVLAALWAGDAGYETGDGDADGSRHRLLMPDGPWIYERT